MARNVDLTGKLGLGGKPTVTIGKDVLTVNDGAQNLLLVLEKVDGGMGVREVMEAASLVFEKKSAERLKKMDLSFNDYATVVNAAIDLIIGGGSEGEAETPATA